MTPARLAAARARVAAALAAHAHDLAHPEEVAARAEAEQALAASLTADEVEVLRVMLVVSHAIALRSPLRLHELGLVRPVPVRGGVDAWEITSAGVGAHCAARSLARRVSNPRK